MQGWRNGRGFGRVAALVLCCLLAADEDAAARRAHHTKTRPAPVEKSEFTGKPNPPGPIRLADARLEPVAWNDIDGWAADDHAAAFATFSASCRALVASANAAHSKAARDTPPVYAPLVDI